MKANYLLFLTTFLPQFLGAQITINALDFPKTGDRFVYLVNDNVTNLSPGDTGRAQVWDFRTFNAQIAEEFSVIDPALAPNIDSFPDANLVFSTGQGSDFSFFQLTDTAFATLGFFIGANNEENNLLVVNELPTTELVLPATFGTKFQSTTRNEQNLGNAGGANSLVFVSTEARTGEVDAYGTMRLAQGDFEVIRVTTSIERIDSTFFENNGVRSFVNAISSSEVDYDWYAKESRGPLVSIISSAGAGGGRFVSVLDTTLSNFRDSTDLIRNPPVAAFDTIQIADGRYIFLDLSDQLPNAWFWDFGDGATSNLKNPQHQFNAPGVYNVCLTVSNEGGSDSTCLEVTIPFEIPRSSFSFVQNDDGQVEFINLTTGSVDAYNWDFGDGNTSTDENPRHQYLEEGEYNVCLVTTNPAGSDTLCQLIVIDNLVPEARFTRTEIAVGNYQFNNNSAGIVVQQTWDFGDGNMSNAVSPTHQFTSEGSFEVCLVVENQSGRDTTCQTINVENLFPDAAFSITQEGPGRYSFEDLTTNAVTSWQWDFGDGNQTSEQNPIHQFLAEGDFTVCLIVGNEFGQDTICQQLSISNLLPVSIFSQDSIGQGRFQFFNQSSANSSSFSWSFGDDSTSTERNPIHQYASEGTYEVCLSAQNEFGRDTSCASIEVRNVIPDAAFMIVAQEGDSIRLMDTSANLPTDWVWDFGDGSNSTEQNPSHRYQTSGMYQVCLTSSNRFGTDSICQEINIIISDVLQTSVARELQISPNPFQDYLQINWQGTMPKTILVFEIYNAQGQQMGLKQYLQANQSLPIGHWPAGSYWLQIKTQNGRLLQTFPLIKQ